MTGYDVVSTELETEREERNIRKVLLFGLAKTSICCAVAVCCGCYGSPHGHHRTEASLLPLHVSLTAAHRHEDANTMF